MDRRENRRQQALAKAAAKLAAQSVMKVDLGQEGVRQLLEIASELKLDGPKAVLDRAIDLLRLLRAVRDNGGKVFVLNKDETHYELDIFANISTNQSVEPTKTDAR